MTKTIVFTMVMVKPNYVHIVQDSITRHAPGSLLCEYISLFCCELDVVRFTMSKR